MISQIGPQHRTQNVHPRGNGFGGPSGGAAGFSNLLSLDFRSLKYFGVGQTWMSAPAAATKTWRWKMQETTGNITDDLSGDAVVLTSTNTPNLGTWTPIHSAAGFDRKGVYLAGGATPAQFVAATGTPCDVATEDFSVSFWICPSPAGANKTVLAKTGTKGYDFYLNATNNLRLFMSDGVGAPDVQITGVLSARVWYFVTVNIDRDGSASGFINGSSAGAGGSVATGFRTISDAVPVRIGAYGATSEPWVGGISELMFSVGGLTTIEEHQAMYKVHNDPNSLLTYVKTGSIFYDAEENATKGRMVAGFPSTRFPFAYNATSGLGFPVHGVVTNLCLQSCNLATSPWAGIGAATITEKASEGPHGQYVTTRILAVSAHDGVKQAFGTVAAVTHTFSLMAKKSGGTTGVFHLNIVRNSTNAEIATVECTATTKWARYSISGTAVLNDTRIEIMVDQNEQVDFCMCQFTATAQYAGVTLLTTTAAVASVAPAVTVTTPAGKCLGARGEIDATVAATYAAQVAAGYIFDAVKASAEIALTRTTGEAANLLVNDAAGATKINASSADAGFTTANKRILGDWNATAAEWATKYGRIVVDGVSVAQGDAAWTAADADTTIAIGCKSDASAQFEGVIIQLAVKR